MSEFNQEKYCIEQLTLKYMEHTCDISKMSIEEYVNKFNELFNQIEKKKYPHNKLKSWLG